MLSNKKRFEAQKTKMESKIFCTISISLALMLNCCIFAIPLTNEKITEDLKSVVPLRDSSVEESSENRTDNGTAKNL